MSELKKCPCCPDGKGKLWAAYDGTYCVQCDKCGLTTLHKFSKQDVAAAWNRRAQSESKPLTNADRIRAMSDEELAVFLAKVDAAVYRADLDVIAYRGEKVNENLDWLKQEVKE